MPEKAPIRRQEEISQGAEETPEKVKENQGRKHYRWGQGVFPEVGQDHQWAIGQRGPLSENSAAWLEVRDGEAVRAFESLASV